MTKQLIGTDVGSYTFDASAQTITLVGLSALTIDKILLITNATYNIIIYNFASLGGSISGNVITLAYDTTLMEDLDDLQIFIDYPDQAIPVLTSLDGKAPDLSGAFWYSAGTSGTLVVSGGKRVLEISAIAIEASASFTIDGGDSIILPYGSTDKAGSSYSLNPLANLTDPTIVFTGTKAYVVQGII